MGGNVDLCFFWVEVYNGTSEVIPPYAVMEVSSVSSGIYTVVKPTGNNPKITLVNGGTAIAPGDYGTGTYDSPTYVLYDTADSTPTLSTSTEWGPVSGSWKLRKTHNGFTPLGDSLSDYTSGSVDGTALFARTNTAIPTVTSFKVSGSGGTFTPVDWLEFSSSNPWSISASGTHVTVAMTSADLGVEGYITNSDQYLGGGTKTAAKYQTPFVSVKPSSSGSSTPPLILLEDRAATSPSLTIEQNAAGDDRWKIIAVNSVAAAYGLIDFDSSGGTDTVTISCTADMKIAGNGIYHNSYLGATATANTGLTFGDGLYSGITGTVAEGDIFVYAGAAAWGIIPNATTAGKVLTSSGTGLIPVWSTPSGGTGTVTGITAGAGLTGGVITTSGTIAIDTTGVSAGSYGSGSSVAMFAVNARGQLTAAGDTPILISSGQVSGLATSATTDTTDAANISSGTLNNSRLSSVPNSALANSAITIAGTSTSLGGAITLDTITGLSSTGLVKRSAANTLAIATAGTDYATATNGTSGQILTSNGSGGFGTALAATITIDGTAVAVGGTATRKIAVLTNEQTSGTDAGTATASTWVTVPLNTLQDPAGIVSSFGSNQFTLGNGTYVIRGRFPNFATDRNQASLRNVTSSSYDAYASSTRASSANQESSCSWMMKQITISGGSKTFEFRHWCGTTRATSGLGLSTGSGGTEVYATVEIEKIA